MPVGKDVVQNVKESKDNLHHNEPDDNPLETATMLLRFLQKKKGEAVETKRGADGRGSSCMLPAGDVYSAYFPQHSLLASLALPLTLPGDLGVPVLDAFFPFLHISFPTASSICGKELHKRCRLRLPQFAECPAVQQERQAAY